MQPPLPVVVNAELRRAVAALIERIGPGSVEVAPDWSAFAAACGLRSGDHDAARPLLVVGTLDEVIDQVRDHEEEFGFVTPAAITVRPWQRGESRRWDPTMRLWQLGWSPVDVERIMVATDDGAVEFVVGNARRTPAVSPLDDAD